jgi:hypothetical protein
MYKGDEMGRTCSMNEGEEECIQGFEWKPRRSEPRRKTKI